MAYSRLPLDALPAVARTPELEATDDHALSECLQAALDLLSGVWPAARREVRYFVRAVASGQMTAGRQSSGSSVSHPFAIRVDFCPDDPLHLLADALVHEAAHVKLRLAGSVATFCIPEDDQRMHHPWRPDPRPLSAMFVACHAFVAVHGFHARRHATGMAADDCVEAGLRPEVAQALATLLAASGLTDAGRSFAEMLASEFEANCRIVGARARGFSQ